MRNRAKCKLCNSTIESFHSTDYVLCNCSQIAVLGGDSMGCAAKQWDNFIRVDDEGNEIIVKVKELDEADNSLEASTSPSRKELLSMLDDMIKNVENLPSHAMTLPITHYDYCSLMILLSTILRCDCDCDKVN
jgi:hypothetical protein